MRTTLLNNDMDISKLMVSAQEIKESKLREMNRDGKRPTIDEPCKINSKNIFYNKHSSMRKEDRVSNKNSQKGGHSSERPWCTTCGKEH